MESIKSILRKNTFLLNSWRALKRQLKKSDMIVKLYRRWAFEPPPETHWCRIVMNQETQKIVSALPTSRMKVLEISGSGWRHWNFASYQSRKFPEYDVCADPLPERFDFIITEQVFEHLTRPYRAAKNIYSMLNDGGYFLITTPFLIKFHPSPTDCSRWTETGMQYFLEEAGFSMNKIITGSWGNKSCVVKNLKEWPRYNKFLHSLKNDPDYPIMVWALAQK